MACIEFNWLCKHVKKVKPSQASISVKQFFPVSIVKCLRWQYMIDETIHCLLKTLFEPGNTPFTNCFDRAELRLYHMFWRTIRKNIDGCQQLFGPLKQVLLEGINLHFCVPRGSLGQYYNTSLCLLVLIYKPVSAGSVLWLYYL